MLTGFTFSPTAVDTTTSSATVNVTAQVTDNLSGVNSVHMDFVSPSGAHGAGGYLSLTSGNDLNGTWTGAVTLAAYTEAGTWSVAAVVVEDNAGNSQEYYTSDLQALGFPTQLQVTSNQDTTPPVLTGFTFSPTAVDTTTSSATVNVTAQVTDNFSGVNSVHMDFVSPSGAHGAGGYLSLTSGNDLNGTWTGAVTLTAYTEAGTWSVAAVVVEDNAGNSQEYYTSDLQALGFPTQLFVDVASTTTTVTSSSNPSVLGQSVTFTATVRLKALARQLAVLPSATARRLSVRLRSAVGPRHFPPQRWRLASIPLTLSTAAMPTSQAVPPHSTRRSIRRRRRSQ